MRCWKVFLLLAALASAHMASGLSQQGHKVAAEQGSYGMLSGDSAFHEDELEEAAVPAQEPSAAHHGQKEGSLRAHMGQAEPDLAEGGSPSAEIRTVHHTQKNGSTHWHTAQRDADPAGGVTAAGKAPQAQHSQKEVAAERAHMPQLELDAIGLYTPLERAKQADAAGQAAALKGAASASHTHALEAAGQETPLEMAERAAHTHEEGAHHVQKGAQPHGAPAKASESRAHVVIDEHAHHKQARPLSECCSPIWLCLHTCMLSGSRQRAQLRRLRTICLLCPALSLACLRSA